MARLETVEDVIEALGGTDAVRDLADVDSAQAVHNWRARGGFPARLFHAMTLALGQRDLEADPALWGQLPCREEKSAPPPAPACLSS